MILRRLVAWLLLAVVGLFVFAAANSPALLLAAGITVLVGVGGLAREIER